MGRLSLRREEGAPGGGDGIWLFTSLTNKHLKADPGQGRAGPRWLEGPSFFSLVGKSLCLWLSAVLLSCAQVRFFFILILLGLSEASYNLWFDSPLPPQFWSIFSHYLSPIFFSPLLLRPSLCSSSTIWHYPMSLTLYSLFSSLFIFCLVIFLLIYHMVCQSSLYLCLHLFSSRMFISRIATWLFSKDSSFLLLLLLILICFLEHIKPLNVDVRKLQYLVLLFYCSWVLVTYSYLLECQLRFY